MVFFVNGYNIRWLFSYCKNFLQFVSQIFIADQSSDASISIRTALYIFLPMIVLALIILITLLACKKRASDNAKTSTEQNKASKNDGIIAKDNQHDPNQSNTESGYTELHRTSEPENSYASLNCYEIPVENSGSYVTGNRNNYINDNVPMELCLSDLQRQSSYVIPNPR